MKDMRTSIIARVDEFDPVTQLAVLTILANDIASTFESNYFACKPVQLYDVPVHFTQFGDYCITGPVTAGDTALVIFTDRGMSHWLIDNRETYLVEEGFPEAASRRKFNLEDGFAIVGFNNLATAIPNFNMEGVEIRSKTTTQRIALLADGSLVISTEGDMLIEAGGRLDIKASTVHINE